MYSAAMWEHLPGDLLAHVFSFLPPNFLACAMAACKSWFLCARSSAAPPRHPPWLVALPARAASAASSCYAHDPSLDRWHVLPLDFLPCPLRLVAPVGGSLLCKLASSPSSDLRLLLLNPFTRQFRLLPDLTTPRRNPAVGVVVRGADAGPSSFSVIVAGGASGSGYEPTVEMYDSDGGGGWSPVGPMPVEFAVRLTVWTPNESVSARDGGMYWMTSARAYSVVGFYLQQRAWREVKAPMAERLEWAALVRRRGGKLGLVGGAGDGQGTVWELTEEDEWATVGEVPGELGNRFWRRQGKKAAAAAAADVAGATRCTGGEEAVYLFKDFGSEMLVWSTESPSPSKKEKPWRWRLAEGRCSMPNVPIKAALLHPTLSLSPAVAGECEGAVGGRGDLTTSA